MADSTTEALVKREREDAPGLQNGAEPVENKKPRIDQSEGEDAIGSAVITANKTPAQAAAAVVSATPNGNKRDRELVEPAEGPDLKKVKVEEAATNTGVVPEPTDANSSAAREQSTPVSAAGEPGLKVKVEAANAQADPKATAASSSATAEQATPAKAAPPKTKDDPVSIGFMTFISGAECRRYYSRLLSELRKDQNLNEYEETMVVDLMAKGHPDPARKIGAGLSWVQVREVEHDGFKTNCFFVGRSDGTVDDFSTRKCIGALFPVYASGFRGNTPRSPDSQSPQSRGGGRGRSGRSPLRGRGFRGGGDRGRGSGDRGRGGRGGGMRGRPPPRGRAVARGPGGGGGRNRGVARGRRRT